MTWTATAPDGSLSVKANRPLLAGNTTYTKTTMGGTANDTTNTDVIRDHYWDVSSTLDGRHRFVNLPPYTIAGAAEDPVVGDGMGGVFYLRADSIDSENELFLRNATGIKKVTSGHSSVACSGYIKTVSGTPALTNTYNIASVAVPSAGSVTITFSEALADVNYVVTGAIGGETGIGWHIPIATKLVGSVLIKIFDNDGVAVTPDEFYIMVNV